MERLTGRNEKGDLLVNGKMVYAGEFYEVASALEEYEDLEENGKMLKLPCKIGDKIWDNDFGRPTAYEVTGFSVGNMNDDFEEATYADELIIHYSNQIGSITGSFAESEIGKTVFLTEQEAEEALERMEWE